MTTKKPEARRYSAEWREQVHAEAQAFLAKVKARDEAARQERARLKLRAVGNQYGLAKSQTQLGSDGSRT